MTRVGKRRKRKSRQTGSYQKHVDDVKYLALTADRRRIRQRGFRAE